MLLYWSCVLAFMATFRCTAADQPLVYGTAELEWNWAEAFKVNIRVQMQYPVSNGWRMALIFSQPIKKIEVWRAKVLEMKTSADQMTYALKEMYFNKNLAKGDNLTFAVVAHKSKKNLRPPGKVTVLFKGGTVIPILPTVPPPTTPPEQLIPILQLKPIDESDTGFKMIIDYQVPKAVPYWCISLKFTKNISTRNFGIDKAKVTLPREPICDSFCLGPRPYNENLQANSSLRLEFNCNKAKLFEAAPIAFFVFHPDSAQCEDFDLPVPGPVGPQESTDAELIRKWGNEFKMKLELQMERSVRGSWKITLKFSDPVAEISNLNIAKVAGKSKDRLTYYIENFPGQIQYANMKQCKKLKIEFGGKLAASSSNKPLTATASFERKEPEYAEVDPQMVCSP
ncbi:hypothetical protein OS493_006198 [Desmophyllum pertusum]|uniref:Uncharacterized protein n=1 Tax=Desmophyllum pertusum TaxID=174260 RepID=A0A9X0A5L8_9CNID|nr:hypothetical protein OS493_006198 [Desmophyllum pertusum]